MPQRSPSAVAASARAERPSTAVLIAPGWLNPRPPGPFAAEAVHLLHLLTRPEQLAQHLYARGRT